MDTKTKDQTATAPALLDEAANAEFITALGHRVREARARGADQEAGRSGYPDIPVLAGPNFLIC